MGTSVTVDGSMYMAATSTSSPDGVEAYTRPSTCWGSSVRFAAAFAATTAGFT